MIEPEMAFYDLDDNMDLAEAFLKRIISDALEHCAEDMKFFHERIDKDVLDAAGERARTASSCACRTPRRSTSCRSPARRSSSRSPGATTCSPSTSAT